MVREFESRALLHLSPLAGRGRIASAIRVRGSRHALLCFKDSWIEEPLTPTLSPQGRGEGAHLALGNMP
jgi:hypothetical protein